MKRFDYTLALKRLSSLGPLLLLLISPIPLFYILFYSHVQLKKLDATEAKIDVLQRNFILAKLQKERENTYLAKLKMASPYYINEHLESLEFLSNERARSPKQKLRFIEGKIRRKNGVQEVEENQEKAVLMNEEDLKKTLTLVEGIAIPPYQCPPNPPDLIIKAIDVKKIPLSSYENAFEVSMQLIKRESIR